jgi:hypothetical protein
MFVAVPICVQNAIVEFLGGCCHTTGTFHYVGVQVNCSPFPISLSFWVELVGACNSIWYQSQRSRVRIMAGALIKIITAHSNISRMRPGEPAREGECWSIISLIFWVELVGACNSIDPIPKFLANSPFPPCKLDQIRDACQLEFADEAMTRISCQNVTILPWVSDQLWPIVLPMKLNASCSFRQQIHPNPRLREPRFPRINHTSTVVAMPCRRRQETLFFLKKLRNKPDLNSQGNPAVRSTLLLKSKMHTNSYSWFASNIPTIFLLKKIQRRCLQPTTTFLRSALFFLFLDKMD